MIFPIQNAKIKMENDKVKMSNFKSIYSIINFTLSFQYLIFKF